jgi:hypothetical protein
MANYCLHGCVQCACSKRRRPDGIASIVHKVPAASDLLIVLGITLSVMIVLHLGTPRLWIRAARSSKLPAVTAQGFN